MKFTKEELKTLLEHILEELDSVDVEEFDWYEQLFEGNELFENVESVSAEQLANYESSTYATVYKSMKNSDILFLCELRGEDRWSFENIIAIEAIRYPELHKLMRKIVKRLTDRGESIWENEEVVAGGAFARELAMYDKDYIPLYCKYIKTNDLDHEVYQLDDMLAICTKWDYSVEIMPILLYRHDHGQLGGGVLYGDNICKNVEDVEDYLNAIIDYMLNECSFNPDDEDDIRGTLDWVEPIFSKVLGLDEDQMRKFATEFVIEISNGKTPTIETLLAKAKS